MISSNAEKVSCPKCGASDEFIVKFDRDIYIVRDENDFIRRKLYGCKKCEYATINFEIHIGGYF
jgi:ribosomal protein S27AE